MNTYAKTAVVTGANSGIGLALTQKLLAEGYQVIATARSGQIDSLQNTNLTVIPLDITDAASIEQTVAHIGQLAQRIDLLINNAGIAPDVMSMAAPDRMLFRDTFATNVDGTIFFTEPMLALLNDGAQVVFISSTMGLPSHAGPNGTAYRLSKAAVNMYAAMLAQRVADRHIRVTPMHPGWVQTRMGGSAAPFTPEQAANGIFRGIRANLESGRFWNAENDAVIAY
ncbi:SDR family NAD(P)-dependent oxidoreductase [Hymenobacter setariae]|uniref:SDR family NAD(P)-dependent oxidoreductase n=1 Tax=Hymenobacter setariae TaxID=2594794 RepID=A0A558BS64_9BACT|nr:SDR family NAD(P)-dependent oxidoreductase [Hymenobacter setariae]TVT39343.1 SDR family NAD(P)-dependent oxidoreductase [Hymenobacter setariae]